MTHDEHSRQAAELEFLSGTDITHVPDPRPGAKPRAVCPIWQAITWHRAEAFAGEVALLRAVVERYWPHDWEWDERDYQGPRGHATRRLHADHISNETAGEICNAR